MSNIDIEEKLKKLTERKRLYDSVKDDDTRDQRISVYTRCRELADEIYTPTFMEYLKSKPIGHILWSDDTTKAVIGVHHSSNHERIIKFLKHRRETPKDHIYFGSEELKLLINLDDDALKLYCDLSQKRLVLKREVNQIERALKVASAQLELRHLNNGRPVITLKDGRTIRKDTYMGKPYIRVD